jgi:hypothetical protein
MTYQNDFTLSEALLEQLTTSGLDALPTLFQILLNHERTKELTGHANGFKDKPSVTRLGQITVPAKPGVSRPVRGTPGRQRCPRRIESRTSCGLWERSVAALPVPPSAERQCLCA